MKSVFTYCFFLITAIIVYGCGSRSKGAADYDNYRQITKKEFMELLPSMDTTIRVEVTDIYKKVDRIPDDPSCFICDQLSQRNFVSEGYAKGNWSENSYFEIFTMGKDDVSYRVEKLYYEQQGGKRYRVTERIRKY